MQNNLKLILLCLAAWLILIPILIIPSVLLIVFLFWRITVDLLAKWLHPDWLPLYPPDTVHASSLIGQIRQKSKKCSGNICGIVTVKEQITLDELREAFETRLLNVRKDKLNTWKHWRLRVVPKLFLGFVYWEPAPVHLEQHIWEYFETNHESIEDFGQDWISNGFDGRTLWEIMICRPKAGKFAGVTVIYLKISHALGDAKSIQYILEALCNVELRQMQKMEISWGQLLFQITTLPIAIYKFIRLPKNNIPKSTETVQAYSRSVEIKVIKSVAKLTGCAFREVVSSTLLSAVRRFMLESRTIEALPEAITIGVALPALYFKRSLELVANRGTACVFAHPMRLESPLERLYKAHRDLQENLQIGQDRVNFFVSYLNYVIPAGILSTGIMGEVTPSLISVDVCFTANTLKLFGKYQIPSEWYGALALEGRSIGAFGLLCTVEDTVSLCLTANKHWIPDKEAASTVCRYFNQELEFLHKLIHDEKSIPSIMYV